MTLPSRLHAPELRPLWHSVHERLSSGKQVSKIRVGPLNPEQRAAVADLLGMSRYAREYETVPLATLDRILLDSAGVDARDVVGQLIGPVDDRASRKARTMADRADLWAWLAEHEVVTAQPALNDWVAQVRRAGVINGSVSETRRLLESALLVLRRLPAQGTPLPSFAESVMGDPHALDDNTRLSRLVVRAVAAMRGLEVPTDSENRRALWESVGVADDELSTMVLAAGIRPEDTSLPAVIARECAGAGHAAALTLGQLRDAASFHVGHPVVRIVENPSVLSSALRRFGTSCPPLVCTSGWPNGAGILLLRMLAGSGAALHYHGDLDGEGIRIASYVMDKTGALPWRMSTADYLREVEDKPYGPDPGRITPASWDTDLTRHLDEHRAAVTEERLIPMLLDDLSTTIPEQV